jgi:predicted MFS family arabinose efflux permease
MHATPSSSVVRLPAVFQRLAWSNLVAQSAEQISLAAAPLVAVFTLGADARGTGLLPTSERMMGRVSALNSTATYGARPLGALLGAAISARWNMDACLVAAAVAFLVQALIIMMSPAARLAAIPEQRAAAC